MSAIECHAGGEFRLDRVRARVDVVRTRCHVQKDGAVIGPDRVDIVDAVFRPQLLVKPQRAHVRGFLSPSRKTTTPTMSTMTGPYGTRLSVDVAPLSCHGRCVHERLTSIP